MTTPVGRWHPSFVESVKLAWRPLLAYFVFSVTGFAAFFLTILAYERGDALEVFGAVFAGLVGLVTGQAIALLRFRTLPVLIAGFFLMWVGVYVGMVAHFDLPKVLVIGTFFFCFALPSGMLSLHHRFELLGAFWPSVGWIGAVMIILNNEGRITKWEESKVSAWLPIPLLLLGGFLVGLLFFMASKQAMRVSIWEALSGATERRVQKRSAAVSALPKKNVLPLLGAAMLVFAFTAVLAPYLWRTGKGDHKSEHAGKPTKDPTDDPSEPDPRRGPQFDEEAIRRAMQRAGESAQSAARTLWPLLLLALLYRPVKRAALTSHLVTPIFPTPPSERIENLWEYIRIAAEDAGTLPLASDSVEQFVDRAVAPPTTPDVAPGAATVPTLAPPAPASASPSTPALDSPLVEAARIYVRTRYGFVVAPGDALGMKRAAVPAAKALRARMNPWDHVKAWWRPLS